MSLRLQGDRWQWYWPVRKPYLEQFVQQWCPPRESRPPLCARAVGAPTRRAPKLTASRLRLSASSANTCSFRISLGSWRRPAGLEGADGQRHVDLQVGKAEFDFVAVNEGGTADDIVRVGLEDHASVRPFHVWPGATSTEIMSRGDRLSVPSS